MSEAQARVKDPEEIVDFVELDGIIDDEYSRDKENLIMIYRYELN